MLAKPLLLACLVVGCSGTPPPPIGGAWSGKWSSGRGLSGAATVTFEQSGSSVQGTFTMDHSPCVTGGTIEGSVDGQHLTGHLKSGTSRVAVDLTLTTADRMDGTYDAIAAGLCTGDKGAVTLSRGTSQKD